MNGYIVISVSMTIALYVYLAYQIHKEAVEQNLSTWLSWALLDAVVGTSLFAQGGNWYLLAFYVVGSTIIICFIVKSAKFGWGWVESTCFGLVIVSLVLWPRFGPWYATIISTLGVAVATYPQLKDTFLEPEKMSGEVFVGFTVVNALGTAAGSAWTVEERLYPAVCTVLSTSLVLVWLVRKYIFVKKPRDA